MFLAHSLNLIKFPFMEWVNVKSLCSASFKKLSTIENEEMYVVHIQHVITCKRRCMESSVKLKLWVFDWVKESVQNSLMQVPTTLLI